MFLEYLNIILTNYEDRARFRHIKLGREKFLQSFPTWDIDKNLLVKLDLDWKKFLLNESHFLIY